MVKIQKMKNRMKYKVISSHEKFFMYIFFNKQRKPKKNINIFYSPMISENINTPSIVSFCKSETSILRF